MSDNLKRFRTILKYLKNSYPTAPKGNLLRRLHTLAAMINGIVASNSSNLPKIAAKQVDNIKNESRVKTYTRWLQNEYINFKLYFLPFLEILINSFSNQTLFLSIDGSVVGRGCMCLMVSLIYKNRALPLCWMVVKQKKGHLPEDLHLNLIQMVKDMIPSDNNVVLLGDGEFDGIDLQAFVAGCGWEYVLRTAHSSILFENGEQFSFDNIRPSTHDEFFSIPNVEFTRKRFGPVHAIIWWQTKHKEPIFLLTNIALAQEACHYYKKRFKIETFFSDQKSRGFNIHKSHVDDPDRILRLLIAACLAYIWIIYLGTLAMKDKWYPHIHRTDRCDLSLFSLGLRLLEYFINFKPKIPIKFSVLDFDDPFD